MFDRIVSATVAVYLLVGAVAALRSLYRMRYLLSGKVNPNVSEAKRAAQAHAIRQLESICTPDQLKVVIVLILMAMSALITFFIWPAEVFRNHYKKEG